MFYIVAAPMCQWLRLCGFNHLCSNHLCLTVSSIQHPLCFQSSLSQLSSSIFTWPTHHLQLRPQRSRLQAQRCLQGTQAPGTRALLGPQAHGAASAVDLHSISNSLAPLG
jgi:hypothetical protein